MSDTKEPNSQESDKSEADEEKKEHNLTTCHEIARHALKLYAGELASGGISQEILTEAFKKSWTGLDAYLKGINKSCSNGASSISAALKVQEKRKNFFGRLIVHEISALIPLVSNEEISKEIRSEHVVGKIPRDVIYGYMGAVDDMFGDEFRESAQKRLTRIIDANKNLHTGLYDWDKFYSDPESKEIRLDIFTKIKEKCAANDDWFEWFRKRITRSEEFTGHMKRGLEEEEFRLILHTMFNSLGKNKPDIPF